MDENIGKLVLENGVTVVYEQIPQVRSVSMGILTGVGSRMEKASENGASHFIEHMLFKGTETRTAQEIAFQMDAIGGQTNAFTTKECTCFHGRVLDTHLDRLSDILCDMYFHSRFDDRDVENERGVIGEEIDMYRDTPDDVVAERLFSGVYGNSSLARPILGTKTTLKKMNGAFLRDFMQRNYCPSQVVVALSGHFYRRDLDDIAGRFSEMKPQRVQKLRSAAYAPLYTVKHKKLEQNHLCIGFPGIAIADERRYAAQLMSSILGGGMSSRLFQKVREEKGLCYTIYSFGNSYVDTGLFCLYTALGREQEADAIRLIGDEVQRFLQVGITSDELAMAREQVKANVIMSLESTGSRMHRIARNQLFLGEQPDIDSVICAYDSVTKEDILTLAREIFVPEMLSFSAVGKTREAEEYRPLVSAAFGG